jgi:ABC-type branched-subunit amino acid transport system permease subunit
MFLFLFVSSYILYRIAYSKTGIILVSILDDEVASKASGINTTKYKLMAFAISGLFGGLAGCLYAHLVGVAGISTLMLTQSFMPIIVTILGGIGTIYGPIVGTYILMFLGEFVLPDVIKGLAGSMTNIGLVSLGQHLEFNTTAWAGSATSPGLIFMIIVVIFILTWPTGIAKSVVDKLEDLSKERELEERGKRIWKRYKKKESPS